MTDKLEKPAKKTWKKVNGLVIVNKPEGLTSNAVLQKVRRFYSAEKAGHTGALDPFATGLLPICFGEATKISGLLLDADKGYIATLKLGQATDSGDKDGEPALTAEVPVLTSAQIASTLETFLGDSTQVPPMYSALKYQGKPLYSYARQGIEIERPARHIHLSYLKLLEFNGSDTLKFEVNCSKGTYVRTLGEDIAQALGTVGHLIALHRVLTGCLTADLMMDMDELATKVALDESYGLLPLDLPLGHLESLNLSQEQTDFIQHGGMLALPKPATELVKFYNPEGVFFGVGEWSDTKQMVKAKRLFNL
ncbi:tRNA pseudouridine(55) synthase TruB [Thiosulfativibrio zosterae]|uniref:tRNA pseudouridine synthase B n=1 Tax=Thiosulfativibrio zosterae TaxID=2675053 RepID=A0A6F8PNA4_9GAMM|nr:tRNA pseudouridine(55) synthase TruB [Thiosulfativibrio zosterae]BBP43601.1 tRNA pseudouridine synthase B [Thiosulfativibrio zosterae]